MLDGKDAVIVGDDNAKNGADRMVDGVNIQSKYCNTGSKCIYECFENGRYRYYNTDGSPMQVEVPSDKYDDAVKAMAERIKKGQVPGVTDPAKAKDIVRKGNFTYEQAKNIAKAGTVESITFDSVNGAIISAYAFGLSAALTFAVSIWKGDSSEESLKAAAAAGLKVGGTTFLTAVLTGQLQKSALNGAFRISSDAIVNMIGPKASQFLVNAFRTGKNIYGAAAMKSVVPVIGTAVGGFVGGVLGSFLGGSAANSVSSAVMDEFIEDDAKEMVAIIEDVFKDMAVDYLISESEAEEIADILKDIIDGGFLKDMYASDYRYEFAKDALLPVFDTITMQRPKIILPDESDLCSGVRQLLEEMADE